MAKTINKPSIYSILVILFSGIVFFPVGFFFGYKTKVNDATPETSLATTSSSISSSSVTTSVSNQRATSVTNTTEVFWIKVGTNPVCPETHPIKGKFDSSTAKFYYTTENKNYDRVRPDICFTTENFAKDVAGFVKKF